MADNCCPELHSSAHSVECPECRTAGRPVESVTVKAMLTRSALARYKHEAYRFCAEVRCTVAYFGGGGTIVTTSDLTGPLFGVAGLAAALIEEGAWHFDVTVVWGTVLLGVGAAFVLEWRTAKGSDAFNPGWP